jgi:protein kinase A
MYFSKTICGSPAYLAPEIINGKGSSFFSDYYAIGCIFYEMLVGNPPFYDPGDCDVKNLYFNIRNTEVDIPMWVSDSAKDLLR